MCRYQGVAREIPSALAMAVTLSLGGAGADAEDIRPHDWRASKITNDLDHHENPVEVPADARHHSPDSTTAPCGRRRAEGAKKPAASSAARLGPSSLI